MDFSNLEGISCFLMCCEDDKTDCEKGEHQSLGHCCLPNQLFNDISSWISDKFNSFFGSNALGQEDIRTEQVYSFS